MEHEPAGLDPLRDLSGDAVTTLEALPARQRKGERVWPQCSLSAARNLLRREFLNAEFLADRQLVMARAARGTATQGLRGDNVSDARRRGTFERLPARRLWVSSCEMIAITTRDSQLHCAAGSWRSA